MYRKLSYYDYGFIRCYCNCRSVCFIHLRIRLSGTWVLLLICCIMLDCSPHFIGLLFFHMKSAIGLMSECFSLFFEFFFNLLPINTPICDILGECHSQAFWPSNSSFSGSHSAKLNSWLRFCSSCSPDL